MSLKSTFHVILTLTPLLLALGCTSTPNASELPADESAVQTIVQEESPKTEAKPAQDPPIPVSRLNLKGVKGGKITFLVVGTPSEVADALLNFDLGADHRSWAVRFETLEGKKGMTRARWYFEGKAGINPTVELGFWRDTPKENEIRIRYRLVKKAFGLGAFFGDYVLRPDAQDPTKTAITERTFIDSGVWIANASYEEIEAGLREDAKLLTAWFESRQQD